jgi:hypothetical protein
VPDADEVVESDPDAAMVEFRSLLERGARLNHIRLMVDARLRSGHHERDGKGAEDADHGP